LASLDVVCCFNDETFTFVGIGPLGLFGALVVKHVCIGYKSICFDTVYADTENSAADHHAHFTVFL